MNAPACKHDPVTYLPGQPWVEGTCRLCYLHANGLLESTPSCPYLGEATGGTRECEGCGGRTRLKLFACTHPARRPAGAERDEISLPECGQCPWRPRAVLPGARRLVLHNHLSPGDVLVMTAAVYSLHRQHPGQFLTAVDTTCPAVWEHNPDVVAAGEGFETVKMEYPLINESNQRAVHVAQGYCDFLAGILGVPVPLLTNRPHIYLAREEREWLGQVEEITKRPTRYWVINSGIKQDYTAKQYPFYQEVVDRLQGHVLFVQVGQTEHLHRPLRGVIDLLGKTDDRQLIRLIYHSDGVLCGTTFTMHLAAALEKPAVVLAGGREPRSWNTYPRQELLSTVGMLPCCRDGGCWRSRVVALDDGAEQNASLCECPVPTDPPAAKCMALIRPEEVVEKILRFSP